MAWNRGVTDRFNRRSTRYVRRAPHGRRQAKSQHREEATPGGLADLIGRAFAMTQSEDIRAVPLGEEHLDVSKRTVVTDRVRVHTIVEQRPERIEAMLSRGVLDVERVPAFREVNETPPLRQEGNTIIISIVEERLVKRRFVVEEVVIRTTSVTEHAEFEADVRVMRAEIERPLSNENNSGRDTYG